MKIFTSEEIRRVEERENEIGTGFLRLMELAGMECAKEIKRMVLPEDGPVAIVCGQGKNGGDGFVIGRKLKENDYDVTIVTAFGDPYAADAAKNRERALEAGVPIVDYSRDMHFAEQALASATLIVDTIFGIGFHGTPDEDQTEIFELINRCKGTVVSVDVPSGIDTDTGKVNGSAVRADVTFAITTLKPGHVLYPSREYCGFTKVIDIGILEESFEGISPSCFTLSDGERMDILPERPVTAHKNTFGHVLSVCGSRVMPGAAVMCATAAVNSGAGLVTAVFPESAYPSIASHTMECMLLPVAETDRGFLSENAARHIGYGLEKTDAAVIGCGIGKENETEKLLKKLLMKARIPCVIDADGLNGLEGRPDILIEMKAPAVITPHPGEFSRLTGKSVAEIEDDRRRCALDFAEKYGVTVVLKGPDTIVATPGRNDVYVNTTGNQGLAKGGSGDVLAGMIASFLAQGMEPFTASVAAVRIHGQAADLASEKTSLRGMKAGDILDAIPLVLRLYEE